MAKANDSISPACDESDLTTHSTGARIALLLSRT
jgi:hypothetical protein